MGSHQTRTAEVSHPRGSGADADIKAHQPPVRAAPQGSNSQHIQPAPWETKKAQGRRHRGGGGVRSQALCTKVAGPGDAGRVPTASCQA